MVQSFLTVSTDAKGGENLKIPFTAVIRKLAPAGAGIPGGPTTIKTLPPGTATPMPTKLPLGAQPDGVPPEK